MKDLFPPSALWLNLHTVSNNASHNTNILLRCSHSAEEKLYPWALLRNWDQRQRDQHGPWCSPLWAAIPLMQDRCEPHRTHRIECSASSGAELPFSSSETRCYQALVSDVSQLLSTGEYQGKSTGITQPKYTKQQDHQSAGQNKHCFEMQKSPEKRNQEKK